MHLCICCAFMRSFLLTILFYNNWILLLWLILRLLRWDFSTKFTSTFTTSGFTQQYLSRTECMWYIFSNLVTLRQICSSLKWLLICDSFRRACMLRDVQLPLIWQTIFLSWINHGSIPSAVRKNLIFIIKSVWRSNYLSVLNSQISISNSEKISWENLS